ncbi:30S ribosomal protein S6 [Cladochytrium replicatum]|nr:30S ribosomal protein S6 [Cladochytrium replicatum]
MPLYELICISKTAAGNNNHAKEAARLAARHVLDRGGVVRNIDVLPYYREMLPYRMKRHQEIFHTGVYWSMQFYSSPLVQRSLYQALRYDEGVIRHGFVKLGDNIKSLSGYKIPSPLEK